MKRIETVESMDALDAALSSLSEQPLWVFKHSLTCPVSDAGLSEYRRFVKSTEGTDGRFLLLEIQRSRSLSAAVEERLGLRHESPQAILLKSGKVAWHGSHWQITAAALEEAMCGKTASTS